MTVAQGSREINSRRGFATRSLAHCVNGVGATAPVTERRKVELALPVKLFLFSVAIPGTVHLGPLSLSFSRIVLLVALLPCLSRWLSRRAGPIRSADVAAMLFCIWYGVSFAATEGLLAAIEPAGINMVEVAGAYFLARCYIRSYDEFCSMIRTLFMIMLALLPFAIAETFTGRNILVEFFGLFLNVDDALAGNLRLGLRRANSVFDHPIIFGVAAAVLLPLTHLVLGAKSSVLRRWGQDLVIVCLTLLSLSSAPIGLTALLIALLTWDALLWFFPFRWHIVAIALASAYFGIDILSSQTPVQFFIHHFTFDGQTGWYRLLIWDYGTASVAANPVFGIGLEEWARPSWMVSLSIDNFWLIHFIRNGVPGGILMLAIFGLAALAVGRVVPPDDGVRRCQTAYLLTLIGLFFTGATVHFWGAALVLLLFIVGSGMWIAETDARSDSRMRFPPTQNRRQVHRGLRARGI